MKAKIENKRTEQVNILLTKQEKENVDRIAEDMKGTISQVFRYAVSKLEEEK